MVHMHLEHLILAFIASFGPLEADMELNYGAFEPSSNESS